MATALAAAAALGAPGPGPGPPPGDGHRHRKTVTGKSSPENRHLKAFGTVRGSFWPKLIKSIGFRPNGRHEQFRSAFFIGKSSGISPKALTRVRFVGSKNLLKFALWENWARRPAGWPAGRQQNMDFKNMVVYYLGWSGARQVSMFFFKSL